jgi:hypothetical protein
MQASSEFNILIGPGVGEADKDLFFGPLRDTDVFQIFDVKARFPELLAALGIFRSRSEARKNGWDKDIPDGFLDFRIGKLKKRITILKILGTQAQEDDDGFTR